MKMLGNRIYPHSCTHRAVPRYAHFEDGRNLYTVARALSAYRPSGLPPLTFTLIPKIRIVFVPRGSPCLFNLLHSVIYCGCSLRQACRYANLRYSGSGMAHCTNLYFQMPLRRSFSMTWPRFLSSNILRV